MKKFVGMGAVAHDVVDGQFEIEIVIYDLVEGEHELPKTNETIKEKTNSSSDTAGNLISSSIKRSQTVTARWLEGGGNRVNMHSMKQGEQVEVYKYGQTDRYYFKPFHLEKDLRRKEVGIFSFSNMPEDDASFGEHFDKNSSYTLTVDTKKKRVELHTAMNDGEPVSYTASFDTKAGVFTIKDTNKNSIVLDSVKKKLTISVPDIEYNCTNMVTNASSSVRINTPVMKIGGSVLIIKSVVNFFKKCEHKAVTIFNGLSKTKPGKCPCCASKHIHMLE